METSWVLATPKQWSALFAGHAGWALTAFDVLLYVFALTTIMQEWGLSPTAAGFLASITLFSSAFGGIVFGVIADRIGRKKVLMLSVAILCVCSGFSGLAQNLTQLAIARTILGLGMGGQWTSGAVLVSETWPAQNRGKAIGIMQGGWAIGYLFAAVVAGLGLPVFGWRVLFSVGSLPVLLILWIQSHVDEPEIWMQSKKEAKTTQKISFSQIFHADLIRYTLLASLVSTFIMFAYWGLLTWLPGFLSSPVEKGGAGLGIVRSAEWVVPMMISAFFGYASFGFFADKFGRRPTFAFYLVVSAVLVFIYGKTNDAMILIALGPLVGFFGSGYFSAFGAFLSELFPTRARGAGVGFCYNVGRMLSAFAPTIIGYCASRWGFGAALAVTSFAFIAGAISIYTLPETKGVELK